MKEMFLSLFLFLIYFICCYSYEIKVVDGIDKKGERGPTTGLTYSEPEQISGPEALFILNNHCFLASVDRYEYSVCPFYNITQRRLIGPSATLLGVWGQWLTNDTHQTYDTMVYSNGQTCGRKGRSVTLFLSCGHPSFEIISKSVKESSACEHEITFGIPLSCSLLTKKIYNPHNAIQQTTTTTTTTTSTTSNSIPTDFKKSHSTGPNQYTPPPVDSKQPQYNNQNQHSTFSSSSSSSTSTSSHPATTTISTTTTDSSTSSTSISSTSTSSSQTTKSLISDPTLLSLKQQILELQHTIEHLLSSTTSTTSSSQSSSDSISSTNPTTSHDNSSN